MNTQTGVGSERIIKATAPTRVCDIGGWTDTWFARFGSVLNIAVNPAIEVQLRATPEAAGGVKFHFHGDYGLREQPLIGTFETDPLLEAAVRHVCLTGNMHVEIHVRSDAVLGSSTGTSAATLVALLGALDRLSGGNRSPLEVAREAHMVETEVLGQQSGVQDQLASAVGGINFIEIYEYPNAKVTTLRPSAAFIEELNRRLCLIFVGESHKSSLIHEMVIHDLECARGNSGALDSLRHCAFRARDAIASGDLRGFADTMTANTEAQRKLSSALIGDSHQRIISIAKELGAWGWKVNGAGGNGGSVSILHGPSSRARDETLRAILNADSSFSQIPSSLNMDGLRIWE